MNVKIRPMLNTDRNEITWILDSTTEFTDEEKKVAVELIDLYLKDGESTGYYLAVAQSEFTAVGYICYGPTPMTEGTWDIYWIAVAADLQGKGAGRALLTFAENEIAKCRGRLVVVETSSKDNYTKTRRFYDQTGYQEAARIAGFYTPNDDKIIYVKYLPGDGVTCSE